MSTLVSDLTNAALRLARVTLGPGRTPSTDQSAEALAALNGMLGQWNTERGAIFTVRIDQYTLVAGQQVYTIGPGGDFDAPRPQRIDKANVLVPSSSQGLRVPIQILNDEQWGAIKLQGVVSSWPTKLYNDGGMPLSSIYVWPISNNAYQLELYTWSMLGAFADLTTEVVLPPGYDEALTYNLAKRLASLHGTELTPDAQEIAVRSLANIKSLNTPSPVMACDPGVLPSPRGGSFNWLSGQNE